MSVQYLCEEIARRRKRDPAACKVYKQRFHERRHEERKTYLRSFGIEPKLVSTHLAVGPSWFTYAAGLIDGEGYISVAKKVRRGGPNPQYIPMLSVNMTKTESIRKMQSLFGGSIHRVENKKGNANPSFVWTVCGNNLRYLLEGIEPYLLLKGPQASAAIHVLQGTKSNPRKMKLSPVVMADRDACVELCNKLNTRGRNGHAVGIV